MAQTKILLIEDEDDLARLFEHALARDGYALRRAAEGGAGLAEFRRWRPDLILLDVVLPGTNGFELLEEVRRESKVKVILVSGRRRPADLAMGEKLGADDYLAKPFSLDELRRRVKLALSPVRAAPAARKNSPAPRRASRSAPR